MSCGIYCGTILDTCLSTVFGDALKDFITLPADHITCAESKHPFGLKIPKDDSLVEINGICSIRSIPQMGQDTN